MIILLEKKYVSPGNILPKKDWLPKRNKLPKKDWLPKRNKLPKKDWLPKRNKLQKKSYCPQIKIGSTSKQASKNYTSPQKISPYNNTPQKKYLPAIYCHEFSILQFCLNLIAL